MPSLGIEKEEEKKRSCYPRYYNLDRQPRGGKRKEFLCITWWKQESPDQSHAGCLQQGSDPLSTHPNPTALQNTPLFFLSTAITSHKKKYTRDKVSLDPEPRSSASGPRPPPPAGGPSGGAGCSRGAPGDSGQGGGKAPRSQARSLSRSPAAPGSSSGLRCGQQEPCPTFPRLLGRETFFFFFNHSKRSHF